MADAPRILCIGAVFWESLFQVDALPAGGVKLVPRAGRQHASGMAPAAAITVARLGGRAALLSRVGDDPAGRSVEADLRAAGVDMSGVEVRAGRATPFSSVLVDARGERLVVPCVEPGFFDGTDGLVLDRVTGAAAVLADMRWVDGAHALLQRAREFGVPTVLDADVAPPDALRRLMPLADHLLLSEGALRLMAGSGGSGGSGESGESGGSGEVGGYAQALRQLADDLPDAKVLGVTLGARGAVLVDREAPDEAVSHLPAFEVPVVDTLNAGDVWHGAYAWALARGLPLPERARWAHAAAAIKCSRPWGRHGIPVLDEVRAFLADRARTSLEA
ncbi:PfkB family carbohydrate kinase [Burkholderiaceae bacterium FT117]|uniref:PfkB family carbohydrate kinase n=1 Tax=Zeimonas sediminis TaxID=2944268 RepID=UPI00234314CC|nr:PfkB family carbohydrate kinase [Zeimonas sediminis]MCM5570413.1 PfkB family carbohydrate kinase [Zeimonas sediminis]